MATASEHVKGIIGTQRDPEVIEAARRLKISYDEKQAKADPVGAAMAFVGEALNVMADSGREPRTDLQVERLRKHMEEDGNKHTSDVIRRYALNAEARAFFLAILTNYIDIVIDFADLDRAMRKHSDRDAQVITDDSIRPLQKAMKQLHASGLSLPGVFSASALNAAAYTFKHGASKDDLLPQASAVMNFVLTGGQTDSDSD